MKRLLSGLVFASVISSGLWLTPAFAQDPNEPQIVIYNTEDKTFYEYTLNGEVVEIKVVPKKGEPYYLVPNGGDDAGFHRATGSKLSVPSWVIFRW